MKGDSSGRFLRYIINESGENVKEYIELFFNQISLPEGVRSKIITAIEKIRLEGVGYKRRRTEERCVAPSALGDLQYWEKHQSELGICCHLPPAPKLHGLHVSLRVKAFGNFLDRMEQPPSGQFTTLAMKLVKVCSNIYENEGKFRENVKPIFQEMIAGLDVELDRMHSDKSDGFTSDFTVTFTKGGVKIPLVNFEFKRGIARGKSDPDIENFGYAIKFSKEFPDHAAPMLLVSLAGFSHMQAYGAAWNGDDFCCDPLTHPLSTFICP